MCRVIDEMTDEMRDDEDRPVGERIIGLQTMSDFCNRMREEFGRTIEGEIDEIIGKLIYELAATKSKSRRPL